MEQYGKRLEASKKTKRVNQKKKIKLVVGQGSLPQRMFADDGNRGPYVLKLFQNEKALERIELISNTTFPVHFIKFF